MTVCNAWVLSNFISENYLCNSSQSEVNVHTDMSALGRAMQAGILPDYSFRTINWTVIQICLNGLWQDN